MRPASAEGANGISLIEAQQNYRGFGACDELSRGKVRLPRRGDVRDPGWRPIDPELDGIVVDMPDPPGPWPADATRLYWWRDTYFRRPGQEPSSAPSMTELDDPGPGERFAARVLTAVPEEIRAESVAQRTHRAAVLASEPDIDGYNADLAKLRDEAVGLDYAEARTRLAEVVAHRRMPFGRAEIELFAHFMVDPDWSTHHPWQARLWAWRHRRTASWSRRREQARTGAVTFTRVGPG